MKGSDRLRRLIPNPNFSGELSFQLLDLRGKTISAPDLPYLCREILTWQKNSGSAPCIEENEEGRHSPGQKSGSVIRRTTV